MSDIRTLLFTDIVDSTKLSEGLGDAGTAALWAAHDRLARDLLRAWRGREIDKTDGVLALFERTADAVGYALAYHRAVTTLQPPLAARAGLDTGPVILRENSAADVALGAKPVEVEGMVKPMAARVMPIARGGQTLLTARAAEVLGATTLQLRSHGHWRMKGLSEPVELYEIGDAGAPFEPPPPRAAKAYRVTRDGEHWLPVDSVRHNMPAERDAFVDRHDALLDLARRFDGGARLISVVGIGGAGKTRLALRFAWSWLGDFPGGVWFCDLAPARSLDGIASAVGDALDVPLGKDDPVQQLGHAIAGRGHCLVILDNFEQVARHAEDTLGRWLGRAADARFVVTSREVLGVAGEQALDLAPLAPPDAAVLFVHRAQAARRDFAPGPDDESAIAPLVRLLDGLPLAIELAAARVRVMSPRALLARMSERFKLLASSGTRHDRQATLRATLDWSWDQLAAADKAALAQLSVFEGGFTLEAAEAVLELSRFADAPWPLDAVQSLVEKSLVRALGDRRFDLLTSVQEYAAEHLRTPGRFDGSGPDALAAAQQRHGAYFAGLSEPQAIADHCAELDNLMAACRRAVQRGDAAQAVGALEGAWAGLRLRGPFRAGVELALAVREMAGLDPPAIARADGAAGNALETCGNVVEAKPHFEAALRFAQQGGDKRSEARLRVHLGQSQLRVGRLDEARGELMRALDLATEVHDAQLEREAQSGLGTLHSETGRMPEALLHYRRALELAQLARDLRWEGNVRGNIGNIHASQGRMDEAQIEYSASLDAARAVGERQWEGNMLCNLGYLQQTQGRLQQASGQFEAALQIARELGYARLECVVLCNLGLVLDAQSRDADAIARFDAALALARQLHDRRSEGQVLGYLGPLHARQGRRDAARTCLDQGEALLGAVSDRVSLGILLCGRAEAEQRMGDASAARAALATARAMAGEAGVGAGSELGLAIQRAAALIEADQTD